MVPGSVLGSDSLEIMEPPVMIATMSSSHPSATPLTRITHGLLMPRSAALSWRLAGAAFLLLTAGVHLYLYAAEQYRFIPTVGPLFIMTAVVGVVLAVAVLTIKRAIVDIFGALFTLSVLGGYLLTLYLPYGLFLFKEPGISYSGGLAIFAEVGAAVTLLVAATSNLISAWRGSGSPASPAQGG